MSRARLSFVVIALVMGAVGLVYPLNAGQPGFIAFAAGVVAGIPLGRYYVDPATRRTAMAPRRDRGAFIVIATVLSLSVVPQLGRALGLTSVLLLTATVIGGALSSSLLYTAFQTETMDLVDQRRRRDKASRRVH